MNEELIIKELTEKIENSKSLKEINDLKVEYLGKKGFLSGLSSNMGKLQPSERAEFGKKINEVKNAITTSLEEIENPRSLSISSIPMISSE